MIITIDGPTASGKSTLAKEVAHKLNIYHLNSGYLYRGLAYILVYKFGYNENELRDPKLTDLETILNSENFVYKYDGKECFIFYKAENITPYLKNSEVDNYSSIISSIPIIRTMLLAYQREFAENNSLVMEGRDCGSVVFPNADFKFFLTADLEVRAKRWQQYMKSKDKNYGIQEAIDLVEKRDLRDKIRPVSPLVVPNGAIIIDNSKLNEQEVLDKIVKLVKRS